MRLWFLPLLVAAPAVAEPAPSDALAPVVMPELVARSRIELGVSVGTLEITKELAHARLGGRLAVTPHVEVFGRIAWTGSTIVLECDELRGAACTDGMFGNLVLGARYVHDVALVNGTLSLAGSAWGWLPTATFDDRTTGPRDAAYAGGLEDTRSFHGRGAVGASAAAAWRGDTWLVQAELGAALDVQPVEGGAPLLDNLFGSIAGGRHVSEDLSLVGEWRFDRYPIAMTSDPLTAPAALRQSPGIALAHDDGTRVDWRVRLHALMLGQSYLDHLVDGIVVGLDWNVYP